MTSDLVDALSNLKEKEALDITRARLQAGEAPLSILNDARRAMEIVGERFAQAVYFLPDLVYAGEILRLISEMVKPQLTGSIQEDRLGKCIVGTVAGDIHDIGKDIVVFMLEVNGFEVYDLGIDVPAEKFVDEIRATGAKIVGLSGFLSLAFDSMKATIDAIRAAKLREGLKIMIGGGQIDEKVKEYVGADAYGKDAMAAVTLAKGWIGAS